MSVSPAVRNIAIIAVIAAIVAIVPGGGTATGVILTALYLAFLAAAGWVGAIIYRERRESLFLLGERRRAVLYGAIVVLAVTLTATSRLWGSPGGSVAWLVLVAGAVYAVFTVVWAARRY